MQPLDVLFEYEEEVYKEKNKRLPRVGQRVMTLGWRRKVMGVQTLTEIISVKVETEENPADSKLFL